MEGKGKITRGEGMSDKKHLSSCISPSFHSVLVISDPMLFLLYPQPIFVLFVGEKYCLLLLGPCAFILFFLICLHHLKGETWDGWNGWRMRDLSFLIALKHVIPAEWERERGNSARNVWWRGKESVRVIATCNLIGCIDKGKSVIGARFLTRSLPSIHSNFSIFHSLSPTSFSYHSCNRKLKWTKVKIVPTDYVSKLI